MSAVAWDHLVDAAAASGVFISDVGLGRYRVVVPVTEGGQSRQFELECDFDQLLKTIRLVKMGVDLPTATQGDPERSIDATLV